MKNKIFLGLILGIFLIGLVSASITGYLVTRGEGIRDASGYTATLQKVEGATAIVSVQTPTGDTKLVRVAEGETAKVGDAEISADNLRSGNLFRRGGGNIGLNISNISGATQIKVPGAVGEKCDTYFLSENGTNTFTINGQPVGIGFKEGGFFFSANQGPESDLISYASDGVGYSFEFLGQIITILDIDENGRQVKIKVCPQPQIIGHTHLSDYQIVAESLVETGSGLIEGQASCKVAFGSDYVVLGGGFKLTDALETGMIINGPFSDEAWRVELNANTSSNPGLPMYGKVYAICARIEPTLHQFSLDY